MRKEWRFKSIHPRVMLSAKTYTLRCRLAISYILRQILQQEAQRRAQFQSAKQVVNQQSHQTGDAAAGSDYAPLNITDNEGFHNV